MSESEPAGITLTSAEAVTVYRALRRLEIALAAHDMTAFQLALLVSIAEAPGARFADIARTLCLTSAVITLGVDRLEKRGLVVRAPWRSPEGYGDRRRVVVNVTDRGRELLKSLATIEVGQLDDRQDGDVRA